MRIDLKNTNECYFSFLFQVWFQNRRMKDKRQRIAVAWPYAAVYSDPAFAASILQAAANSVGMPYGYPPAPMLPQMPVMAPQIPTASNHFSYGYRYAPYPIPQRTAPLQTSSYPSAAAAAMLSSMPQGYTPLSIPKPHTPPHDLQSPSSPHSALSLSPGSDKSKLDISSTTSNSTNSPLKSLNGSAQGLLMAAPTTPSQTLLTPSPEKPKLFKPYKSEA